MYYAHHLYSDENTEITNLVIPNGVTSICDNAFYGCSGLNTVTIPNGLTTIGEDAFCRCSGLTSVTIPNSVTTIGGYAFDGCSSLTSVNLPNSLMSISNGVFWGCGKLVSVTIPNSVTSIGNHAFHECYALTSVNLPNSVTSIGDYALYDCWGLTSITLGNSVTSIGAYAFLWCTGLKDIYCLTKDIPWSGNKVFYKVDLTNATLHVPAQSLSLYQTSDPWSQFGKIVPLTENEMTGIELPYPDESLWNSQYIIYDIKGHRLEQLQRGLNIVRISDGTTKKVVIK